MMRSGSMELTRRLNCHPRIKCLPEAEHKATRKGEGLLVDFQNPFGRLHEFTRELLDAMRHKYGKIQWLGNKSLCLNHSSGNIMTARQMDELLLDVEIVKVIHFRKNLVRGLLSLEIMRRKSPVSAVDVGFFEKRCLELGTRIVDVCRVMRDSGQPWAVTTQDMLATHEAEDRIFDLFKVKPCERSSLRKQRSEDRYGSISNRDELEKRLGNRFGSTLGTEDGWPSFWPNDIKKLVGGK